MRPPYVASDSDIPPYPSSLPNLTLRLLGEADAVIIFFVFRQFVPLKSQRD